MTPTSYLDPAALESGTNASVRYADSSRLTLSGKDYLPLMQGGMGVDISTAELALEVGRLGGIGHISDAMSPYVSDKRDGTRFQATKAKAFKGEITTEGAPGAQWDPEVVYDASKRYVSSVMQKKTGPGAIFVNVMEKLGMGNPNETLRARLRGALDGGVDGVTLSAGLHNGTLKLIEDHPRFRDVAFGIIVSSARALAIFMRSASRVNRLPDYIIVEGPLAGGHLGFGEDWKNYSLSQIVTEVRQYLDETGQNIPVIAAGGVFNGGDALRMIDLGASGIQVATRFTIANECGLPPHIKQIYLKAREEDIVVNMTSPTGYPMRMLKSSPSMSSNVKPNCAALGYILDKEQKCAYHKAYAAVGTTPTGEKLPVTEKMCICFHFMKYNTYTCGHNVHRLRDVVARDVHGGFVLPTAEEIFNDYLFRKFSIDRLDNEQLVAFG